MRKKQTAEIQRYKQKTMENQQMRNKTDVQFSYYFGWDPRKALMFSITWKHHDQHCRMLLVYIRPQMSSLSTTPEEILSRGAQGNLSWNSKGQILVPLIFSSLAHLRWRVLSPSQTFPSFIFGFLPIFPLMSFKIPFLCRISTTWCLRKQTWQVFSLSISKLLSAV